MLADLAYYDGTENHYSYKTPFGNIQIGVYTDGVKYVADEAGAYWLIDAIMSYETAKFKRDNPFQLWKLESKPTPKSPYGAALTCQDGNGNTVRRQRIPFTDFPFDAVQSGGGAKYISFYFSDGVLMLPSEY